MNPNRPQFPQGFQGPPPGQGGYWNPMGQPPPANQAGRGGYGLIRKNANPSDFPSKIELLSIPTYVFSLPHSTLSNTER
eukprot:1369482-Amorphochlora_amoeboformis.AAC.2